MAILITPPTNYIVSEEYLSKVLTIDNTGNAGTPGVLVDSDGTSGKISDDWLYVSSVKLTTTNTPYRNPSTDVSGYIPSKYIIQVDKSKGYIDCSLLNLLNNANTKIVNLPSGSDYIPLSLLRTTSSTITNNTRAVTVEEGESISDSLITSTDVRVENSAILVKTKETGFIDKSFFNIQRIIRKIKTNVTSNTNYTINNSNQNSSIDNSEVLTIPTEHKDLYVFHNGLLLAEGENYDYTISSGSNFKFKNGLSEGDMLQFVVLN